MNEAVSPVASTCTIPTTVLFVVWSVMLKVCGITVEGSIGLVNCSTSGALMGAPLAPCVGLICTICGAVVSVVEPVVNKL